jgi:hypothetical protein
MKRVGLWAVMGIGLFLTVGLLTVESGYAEEKEHEPTCTLKTLKGRYLFGGVTTPAPSSAWGNTAVAKLCCRISYLQWRRHRDRRRDGPYQRRNRAGEFRHSYELYDQPGLYGHRHSDQWTILRSIHRAQW